MFLNNHGWAGSSSVPLPGTRITAAVHAVPGVALLVRRPHRRPPASLSPAITGSAAAGLRSRGQHPDPHDHPQLRLRLVATPTGHLQRDRTDRTRDRDYAVHGPSTTQPAAREPLMNRKPPSAATAPARCRHGVPRGQATTPGGGRRAGTPPPGRQRLQRAYLTQRNTSTASPGPAWPTRPARPRVRPGHHRVRVRPTRVHTVDTGSSGPSGTRTRPAAPTAVSSVPCPPPSATTALEQEHGRQQRQHQVLRLPDDLEAGTFMRSSQSRCGNTIRVTR